MSSPVSKSPSAPAGVGLLLSRFRGERIIINASKTATDEQIIAAVRGQGIVITLVDVFEKRFANKTATRLTANIGIKASSDLCIMREEIINTPRRSEEKANAGNVAEGRSAKA